MFAKKAEGLVRKIFENKEGYFLLFHRYLEAHHEDVTPNTLDTKTIREFLYYLKNDYVKHKNNHCVKEKYKSVGVSVSYKYYRETYESILQLTH